MKIKTDSNQLNPFSMGLKIKNADHKLNTFTKSGRDNKRPVILFITSFPPRECGIATYSKDLLVTMEKKFGQSFQIKICALETDYEKHTYNDEVQYKLNTNQPGEYISLAENINSNSSIAMVLLQHEFGFFENTKSEFQQFLKSIAKPVIVTFHTVIPHPDEQLKNEVRLISEIANSIIVMTNSSARILVDEYKVLNDKISVIPHGTHLVAHSDKLLLKQKYHQSDKLVLSTFGLLSSGKSIETTLDALPAIINQFPQVIFLIIGKTHPSVVKQEGEKYRNLLESKVKQLNLQNHVQFLNYFMPLPELLEYLQLTDIYLFTSKDPNQAVSGTFSYAISCGCPIISTPIPHAKEVLRKDAGIIFDFGNSTQLSERVIDLLTDEEQRTRIGSNGLQRMASTAWENSAIAHAKLFEEISEHKITLQYNIPVVNLNHLKNLTTDFGMIQFAKINHPDITSGYTLDDNARALIAMCQHYELTLDESDIKHITIYLNFIKYCLQPEGHFLNYVNENKSFTTQNQSTNIADSNGRAIWALGYMISLVKILPKSLIDLAQSVMNESIPGITKIHSTRAMAFCIKGLYYANSTYSSEKYESHIMELADRLTQMYHHESDNDWHWFESYLTYANSILPEAMLCAWLATGKKTFMEIAQKSFEFLLSKIFLKNQINVISNKTWLHKGQSSDSIPEGGQQPIDVAYTVIALARFYEVFQTNIYLHKLNSSFNWFLGNNILNQIIYNPRTGGCYDGLESQNVNLNQGAESTVSYLMSRLIIQKVVTESATNDHQIVFNEDSEVKTQNVGMM